MLFCLITTKSLNSFLFFVIRQKCYKSDSLIITGKLEFHGQTKNIIVNSKLNDSNEHVQINGSFNVIPTDFLIKLPSFMLAEIKDLLNIKFDLYFKK